METTKPTYAIVFPGQGSQFPGMADPWSSHPAGELVLGEASASMGRDIAAGCHDEAALATTEFVQPALLACGVAAFEVLSAEGLMEGSVAGAAGHSLGEFAALVAAGVLTLPQALEVVVIRGAAMQRAGQERPGTMSALLGVGSADARTLCDDTREDDVLVVANENSPVQVVISGSVPAIERAEALAKERKIRVVRLSVAGAFHSSLMEPASAPINEALDRFVFAPPRFPIAENVTGTLVDDPAELRRLVSLHVLSAVRWEACAQALAAAGASTFIECGAGDVLTKLAKRVVPELRAVAVGSPEAAAEALAAPAA